MQSIRPLIPLIAFALSCPVWAAGPSPAALASPHAPDTGSAEVNPYTGTDVSIANLKKELEIFLYTGYWPAYEPSPDGWDRAVCTTVVTSFLNLQVSERRGRQ